jgi:hypothetical protein
VTVEATAPRELIAERDTLTVAVSVYNQGKTPFVLERLSFLDQPGSASQSTTVLPDSALERRLSSGRLRSDVSVVAQEPTISRHVPSRSRRWWSAKIVSSFRRRRGDQSRRCPRSVRAGPSSTDLPTRYAARSDVRWRPFRDYSSVTARRRVLARQLGVRSCDGRRGAVGQSHSSGCGRVARAAEGTDDRFVHASCDAASVRRRDAVLPRDRKAGAGARFNQSDGQEPWGVVLTRLLAGRVRAHSSAAYLSVRPRCKSKR